MRRIFLFSLLALMAPFATLRAGDLDTVKQDQSNMWSGSGAQDATYSAVSLSMLGWGIGLAGGIALLASAIHQSSSSHDSSSCSH